MVAFENSEEKQSLFSLCIKFVLLITNVKSSFAYKELIDFYESNFDIIYL